MGRTKRNRNNRQQLIDPPSPSTHHELYKFLSGQGWKNENRLTVSSFPLTGRGLYAKRSLNELDCIIELPYQSMISYLTLESNPNFRKLFLLGELEHASSVISFQSLLALFLCHQKVLQSDSEWMTYLQTVPEVFTTPYFCHKSELFYLTDILLEHIVHQNNIMKNEFQALMTLIKPEVRELFTLDTFKWAYFVCNSRSVFIDSKSLEPLVDQPIFKDVLSDSPKMALAPLLDLLNHSDRAKTLSQLSSNEHDIASNKTRITNGDASLNYQLQTEKPIKKYEQIFINYGAFNNTKLLLEYGFIIPHNSMDFLEISLDEINEYIKEHEKLRTLLIPKHKYKFIKSHNLDKQMSVDTTDGLNHSFQSVLSILLVPQNLYNLTQVAFGDDLNFDDIKFHAMEILRRKEVKFKGLSCGLQRQFNLSRSAETCLNYYQECIKLLCNVIESLEC